jgi:hypothetical protein
MKNNFILLCLWLLAACAPAPTPLPTNPPTATDVPTATLTATFTPAPSATPSPVPSGPCDNPLVPLVVGNQWKYRATTGSGESVYTLTALERQENRTIVVLMDFTDLTRGQSVQERVLCQDGAIDNFPLFVMDMHFADQLEKLLNTYHERGAYAPPYAFFADKNWIADWESDYLTEDSAVIRNPAYDQSLIISSSSPIALSFQMDGTREPIKVPAGEFPAAVKVSHSFELNATIGNSAGVMTVHTTQWYAPYVGLLRAQVDSATLETFGQSLEISLPSVVELVEFTAGK